MGTNMADELEARIGIETFKELDTRAVDGLQRLVDSVRWVVMPPEVFGLNNVIDAGVDVCHIPTVEEVLRDSPELRRTMFTPYENTYAELQPRPGGHLAACFGLKEAGFKGFGFSYKDVGVIHRDSGKPDIRLTGFAEQEAKRIGLQGHIIGISHHDVDVALVLWIGITGNQDAEFRNI